MVAGASRGANARAGVAALLAVAAAAAGCADRADASPVSAPCISAGGLEVVADRGDGSRIRIAAGSASLDPGFPAEVGGTFEEARLDVERTGPGEGTLAQPEVPETRDAGPTAGEPSEAERFSVRAHRMRYDSRADRASFSGDVVLTMGTLVLTCDSVEVAYRRSEGNVDFTAAGSVRIERPDMVATAGRAEYGGATRVLSLTESPRVEGSIGVIEGTRIVLALGEETVTVEEVRGRFTIR